MATLEEVISALTTNDDVTRCVIDPDTRNISIPSVHKTFGVESDEKVTRIPFMCPKIVGDNIDLSDMNLYVNYRNANGELNVYLIDDVEVRDEDIVFSWLLSRKVTEASGTVQYIICAKKSNDEGTTNEWNTTIATATVGSGIEATQVVEAANSDVIEQILLKLTMLDPDGTGIDRFVTTEMLDEVSSEIISDIPTLVSQLTNDSGYLTEHQDISTKADIDDVPCLARTLSSDSDEDELNITASNGNWGEGAWLALRKTDREDKPGSFELYAFNEDGSDFKSLLGNNEGELSWGDEKVLTESDLPTNISELQNDIGYLTEHQDISGKADKSEIPKKMSQLENDTDTAVFGFIEHEAVLSPSQRVEYIDANSGYTPMSLNSDGTANYGSWSGFKWLEQNKPWMVHSNGIGDYQLNPLDYTKKLDGSASDVSNLDYDGGAFSWIPVIYKQEYKVGTDRYVRFSLVDRTGFKPVGFVDPDGCKLSGVWFPMFYGHIDSNSKMRSISGTQPSYNTSTATEKNAISAFSSRAVFAGGSIINTLNDLMVMFTKSTNSDVMGKGNQSGYNSSASPTYGVLPNAVVGGGQFYGTTDGKSLNKIFHSVMLGSYQQWQRDPYILGVDGVIKISPCYTYDLSGDAYETTGAPASASAANWYYPSEHKVIDTYGIVPITPYNGSTSLGNCDGIYLPADYSGVRVALRFGACNSGANAGRRALLLTSVAGAAYWYVGASVVLLPPV